MFPNKVIEALKWSKIHHTEYKDITINTSKLNWMHHKCKAFVLDQIRDYQIKGKQTKKTQLASVSKVQCMRKDDGKLDLEYVTIAGDDNDIGIDPKQKEMMDKLIDTVSI